MTTPTAARQRAYRTRKAEQGATEVRGIFAPAAVHARIKAYAARLAREALAQRVAAPSDDRT